MSMKAKGDETPCVCSSTYGKVVAMDFLDEYWFFHNILKRAQIIQRPPPLDISSPTESISDSSRQEGQVATTAVDSAGDRISARALLRTPSLPPRMEQGAIAREEVVPFKQSNSKLRHSCSSLDEHQSYSSSKSTTPSPSTTRHRRPRRMKVDGSSRYSSANNDYMIKEADFRRAFHEKKWKSSNDLEGFEVQGFKDLGFVFDKDGLNPSLVRVIPGLRDHKRSIEEEEDDDDVDDGTEVRRPYLSEAWVVQRSAPPMLRWVGGGSAEDMKEQLKFWARAVACNVRQEC